jgi:DNA-binding response OmpR family regulator
VLLVEDDPVSASALQAILGRRGFHVLAATTLVQAMSLLNNQPQFVLLDLMLPDGDGAVVLRHVRQTSPETRVLVTTAVSNPERLRALRSLGPDVILQKPIDLSALLKLIETPN